MLRQSRQQGLLIDDDESTREMMTLLLKPLGLSLVAVETANEALPLIRRARFDLYITDVWLPGIDGFTLCQRIRTIDSATGILFYSGASTAADIEHARTAGADAYVIKPDIAGLISKVKELLMKSDRKYRVPAINPDYVHTAAAVSYRFINFPC